MEKNLSWRESKLHEFKINLIETNCRELTNILDIGLGN